MIPPHTDQAQWFAEEVHPHDASLKAYLRRAFPAVGDVDDVVQESYLQLWRARAAEPVQSARGFLFSIARRVALKVLRKHRGAPFVAGADTAAAAVADERPCAFAALAARERIELLADALMALPPRCREVFFLHKIEGRPQREVAARLGLGERTVETHIRLGTARCHAFLAARGLTSFRADET